MSSPQKIRANQQNALRSTGPRSISGKRRSARNSVRHGLSITGLAPFEEPKVEAIVDLLQGENFAKSEAKKIAQAILVYERNEAHQQDLFANQHAAKTKNNFSLVDSILGEPIEPSEASDILMAAKAELANDRSEEAEELKGLLRILTMMNKDQIRADKKSEARRYFKRAANQLAKAVKSLATPIS
jgi:hypothetical protein